MITALVIVAAGGLICGGLIGYALGWGDGRSHALTRDYELVATAVDAPDPEFGALFDQDVTADVLPFHRRPRPAVRDITNGWGA